MSFNARDLTFLLCGVTGGVGLGLAAMNVAAYLTIGRTFRNMFRTVSENGEQAAEGLIAKLTAPVTTNTARTIVEEALTMLFEKNMKEEARTIMNMWNSSMVPEYHIK